MSDAAYPDALPSQHRLHWYVLDRVLGQGGFGITYLARDTNLDQAVAIKEYLPVDVATRRADSTVRPRSEDQAERYRWGLDRFIREARTLARFDHPNIVRVLSVFEQNSTAYMVMRFEEGENFGALLERRHTVSEDELMRVLLPVLDGLKLVHDAGFIHRDIKPDNIHIRADGSPVLLDFGSARLSHGHAHTVTILVAPGYAPFEQYYSSGEDQGPWTDIYSLGATCYRAIAGAAPMDAIARSKGILGSTRELLVPAAAVGAGRYSERLLKAVDHALGFTEKDRPATIDEWRKELGGAKPAARHAPAAPARAGTAPTLIVGEPRAPVARTAALIAVVAAVAVIGGGIGAYMAMRRAPLPPPAPAVEAKPAAPAEDATAKRAELERQDKARAEAERMAQAERLAQAENLAQAERDRKNEQQRVEDEARKPQRDLAARRKADLEDARKARISAKDRMTTPAAAPLAAAIPPPTQAAPVQDCPVEGEVATYNCYRELAGRGNAQAALKVGEFLESGRGVARSNNLAYLWYAVAEHRGAAGAKAKKDAVSARLQPVEIQQMDKQARALAQPGK